MSDREMDKVLEDTKVQFEAKTILLRQFLQEAQDTMKTETTNLAVKYKAKIQAARQGLDAREQGLKERECRLQKEEERKREEMDARDAAVLAAENEVTAKKLSITAAQKALEGNRMDLLERQMQLDERQARLLKMEQELEVQKDLVHLQEEDFALKAKSLEEREGNLAAKMDLEEEFFLKAKSLEEREAHMRDLEDNLAHKEMSLEDREVKLEATVKDLEDDFIDKSATLSKREAELQAMGKDLEDEFARKSKSLQEREAQLAAKLKDLEEFKDRECTVILREEELRIREANFRADLEKEASKQRKLDLEMVKREADLAWIDVNAFIKIYEGTACKETQQQLSTLKTLLEMIRKAGMIPYLRKSNSVTFEVGLKENVDEGAASVVASTGFDVANGISNLVKDLVKYIKSHYLQKPEPSVASSTASKQVRFK